jgi:hypothetical protein
MMGDNMKKFIIVLFLAFAMVGSSFADGIKINSKGANTAQAAAIAANTLKETNVPVSTDPVWTAAGELVIGTGAATAHKLNAGATTDILVGGGAADPVWTAATGTGAPVRADSPTFTTQIEAPVISLAGGQITFPSTAVPSAGELTLDEYREGTWTVGITFGGAAVDVTYTRQNGRYIKVGKLVTIWGQLLLSSKGTSNGNIAITGLPFAAVTATNYLAVGECLPSNFASITGDVSVAIASGASSLILYQGVTTLALLTDANATNDFNPIFSITYEAAD